MRALPPTERALAAVLIAALGVLGVPAVATAQDGAVVETNMEAEYAMDVPLGGSGSLRVPVTNPFDEPATLSLIHI